VIEKRHGLAKILNYSSFTEYKLKELMAKNTSTVEVFLEDIARKIISTARKEFLQI